LRTYFRVGYFVMWNLVPKLPKIINRIFKVAF
jgi:hypothetical protein